jgi:hypothetical protein
MQELPGDRFPQVGLPMFTELDHSPNRLAAAFLVKAAIMREAGQSGSQHFIHGLEMAAGQLLPDN